MRHETIFPPTDAGGPLVGERRDRLLQGTAGGLSVLGWMLGTMNAKTS